MFLVKGDDKNSWESSEKVLVQESIKEKMYVLTRIRFASCPASWRETQRILI